MKAVCLLAAVLWASPVYGQVPAVDGLKTVVERYGKTASTRDNFTMTYEAAVLSTDGCNVLVGSVSDNAIELDSTQTMLALSRMTPVVTLDPWKGDHIVGVLIATADGQASIALKNDTKGKNPLTGDRHNVSHQSDYAIPVGNTSAAEAVRSAFAAAITACGGRPSSPLVIAQRDSAARATDASVVADAGQDSLGKALTQLCQGSVRGTLKAPSSAVFAEKVMVLGDSTGRTVLGDVEGMNGFGGRVKKAYMCTYKPFGDSWIPKSPASVF